MNYPVGAWIALFGAVIGLTVIITLQFVHC